MRAFQSLIAILVLVCSAGKLQAETCTLGGIRWDLSDDWRCDGETWALEGKSTLPAQLLATVLPGPMSHAVLTAPRAESALEVAMQFRGFHGAEVLESSRTSIDGAPAWRVRMRAEIEGRRIEQVLWVLRARETVALTFTCDEDDFRKLEPEFARVAQSMLVLERPRLIEESPASLCGALLGVLAGVCCAAWRRRHPGRRPAPFTLLRLTHSLPTATLQPCSSTQSATT